MNVLIVDDEAPARDRLRQLLQEDGTHVVIGEAENGKRAIELAAELQPDVVVLDIRMPGLNGIETAHHLNTFEKPPAVIFATAYDEYAIEAFEASAIGYVLKPVRRRRLNQALQLAQRLSSSVLGTVAESSGISGRRNHVCTRSHGEIRLIPISDVKYFVADQKYVSVFHENGQDLIDDSLKSLEEEFEDSFVRIHRGALVAVACIESLRKTEDGRTQVVLRDVVPDDVDVLVVSRRHLTNVKRRLKQG
ncbi:MAG: LytTR family DNA-binding domain-containing protein [Woeseiaceae bacterium]|nr:LytTR family DNA-binding domain-containing protein [Woeseiaceae bacterium]